MPTRLTQAESHASGSAALQITGPNADRLSAEDVEISIVQPGQVDLYLDPRNPDHPWSTTVFRFRPLNPRREGTAGPLDIDYGVTYHLRANQPYKLKLRGTNGAEVEERFTGSANLRRPTTIPRGWTPPPDPRGPVAPPPPVEVAPPPPEPPSVEPTPAGEAEPTIADTTELPPSTPEPESEKPSEPAPEALRPEVVVSPPPVIEPKPRKPWLALAAGTGVAGRCGCMVVPEPRSAGSVAGRPAQFRCVAGRHPAFPRGQSRPAAAREKGEALAADGKLLDGQFLLFKYAAERGDAKAARALGAFYDPHTWAKDKSPLPAPNPLEAARWHKMAAEAGDAESQYRYGMLLREGGTDEPNGPEMAVAWLRKSAEQGNADAKKALGQ